MISVYSQEHGATRQSDRVDPGWLAPGSGVVFWVDLMNPSAEEGRILTDVFHFHELAVEDALGSTHFPKVEAYGDYLYLILHRIDFKAPEHCFRTYDVDFFLGANYLVTIHSGDSRSIDQIKRDLRTQRPRVLAKARWP